MTYDEALDAMNRLETRPWRKGLDRMRELVLRAGLASDLNERGYIHVAGTNGKGTTTAFVESILRHQGHRTGAFYSPYVVDYRERIQAEGKVIEREDLVRLVEAFLPIANGLADTEFGGASKFEVETAMALAYWREKRCDWVALEVGLGGRLDATNVVTPRACAIVSIGLDHTAILGNTVEEIAAEKAGIIKPGIPVVVGEMPRSASDIIEGTARNVGAPVWRIGKEVAYWRKGSAWAVQTPGESFLGLQPTLLGERTAHNMALAIAACHASGALRDGGNVSEAVKSAWLPGRFEVRKIGGREVIFDGAHNHEAAASLRLTLQGRSLRLVSNMIAGHDVARFYQALQPVGVEVSPINAPRALGVEAAVAAINALGIAAEGHSSVRTAMEAALQKGDATVVVTGSNYLVGEALRGLGSNE